MTKISGVLFSIYNMLCFFIDKTIAEKWNFLSWMSIDNETRSWAIPDHAWVRGEGTNRAERK